MSHGDFRDRENEKSYAMDICAELHQLRSRYEQAFQVTKDPAEVLLFRLSHAEVPRTRSLRRACEDVLLFV